MADLKTQRLQMVSWTAEITHAALHDRTKLGEILGIVVPEDFPNQPVRDHVLPKTLEELNRDASYGMWSGIIVHVSDGMIIGSMGFKAPPDSMGAVEIGYDIIADYRNHGYATEMAQALIAWAAEQSSVNLIRAQCLADNGPSVRVLSKCGFRLVRTESGMLIWELRVDKDESFAHDATLA